MNPRLLRLAVSCVRTWTWLYTCGMCRQPREARRAEIASDLWEFQCDAAGDDSLGPAVHVVLRLLIGIPDDLGWRVEQESVGGRLTQGGVALSARAAGAAVFFCALLAIQAATSGRQPVLAHGSVKVSPRNANLLRPRPRIASVHPWCAEMGKILAAQKAAQPPDKVAAIRRPRNPVVLTEDETRLGNRRSQH